MPLETNQIVVGATVAFVAYTEKNENPTFQPGDTLKITELASEGVETHGFKVVSTTDPTKQENLFSDEVSFVSAPTKTRARAAAAAPAAAAGKAKGGKAAAATETPAAPAAAAPKLKGGAKAGKAALKVKAPAPEKVKAVEPAIVIKDTETLTALMEGKSNALDAAVELSNQIEESFFTLGGLLLHIDTEGLYKSKYPDKGGFATFCGIELGMQYRKARTLMDVYQTTTAANFDQAKLTSVGWTKARAISAAVRKLQPDSKAFLKMCEYAEKHTREELESYLKKEEEKVGAKTSTKTSTSTTTAAPAETVKKVTFSFKLYGSEADVAEQAIEMSKKQQDTTDASKAFSAIVTEWASMNGGEVTLQQELARLEAKFGVDLGSESMTVELTEDGEETTAEADTTA